MFKKCENVEAIQLMNHAKAFDGSQLLTAVPFEEKKKELLSGFIYLNNSGICIDFSLYFLSCVLFLDLILQKKIFIIKFLGFISN